MAKDECHQQLLELVGEQVLWYTSQVKLFVDCQQTVSELEEKKWQTKLAALGAVEEKVCAWGRMVIFAYRQVQIEEMGDGVAQYADAVVFGIGYTPGYKDSNFQVCAKVLVLFANPHA